MCNIYYTENSTCCFANFVVSQLSVIMFYMIVINNSPKYSLYPF